MVFFGKNGIIISRSDFMNSYSYSENEIMYLSVRQILPNPYQPRKNYDRHSLNELAKSIKQYGILQPICVRYINNKIYELVIGERRLRATIMAGLDTIPATILYTDDRAAAAVSIAENLQRQNLNYIEESEGIRILSEGFKYSEEEISHIINKSVNYIYELSELIDLSPEIKKLFIENNITKKQALSIITIKNDNIKKSVIKKIKDYRLNDEAAAELVENTIRQQNIKNSSELNHMKFRSKLKDIRLFNNNIKEAISLIKNAGMETSYVVSKNETDYEINIRVKI